jgi:hypothetical protein
VFVDEQLNPQKELPQEKINIKEDVMKLRKKGRGWK